MESVKIRVYVVFGVRREGARVLLGHATRGKGVQVENKYSGVVQGVSWEFSAADLGQIIFGPLMMMTINIYYCV